jgi:peptidylprolyl isomerase
VTENRSNNNTLLIILIVGAAILIVLCVGVGIVVGAGALLLAPVRSQSFQQISTVAITAQPIIPTDEPTDESAYITTASGLQYRIIEEGTGSRPKTGDTVSVKYTGKLEDGTIFDSTEQHGGEPIQFTLGVGQVIAGWDEGIALLKEGGKAELVIPPDLGYGKDGYPPVIPENATLIFEVELVRVESP